MFAQVFIYAAMIGMSMGQVLKRYPMIQQQALSDQPPSMVRNHHSPRASRDDINCAILKPSNPACCFMTDRNHERTQGSEPLSTSPYFINLVSGNKGQLNNFVKVAVNDTELWKLTPLKTDPENREEQIAGGPIKLQVSSFFANCVKTKLRNFWGI